MSSSTPTGWSAASHWLLSLPNGRGSAKATLDALQAAVDVRGGEASVADMAPFNVPGMKVGTLDMLMTLSDDLARADTYVEGVMRKCERQALDGAAAKRAQGSSGTGREAGAASTSPLTVSGEAPSAYVMSFKWDKEQFEAKEALPDLLRRLVAAAEKIDGDVRAAGAAWQEKKTAAQSMERKRGGNLMVASLDDVITAKALDAAGAEFIPAESEYLASVVIVMPKASEESFLASYEALDAASVPFGPVGERDSVRGSPVVPGSARRVVEDKDGYVLYLVTILRKFSDSFRTACREKRYTVRDFTFTPSAASAGVAAAADLSVQLAATLNHAYDTAVRKYSEAFALWMHVKSVRMFVETVLRYGMPVNFVAAILAVQKGASRKAMEAVKEAWGSLAGDASTAGMDDMYGDGKNAGGDVAIAGLTDNGTGAFPFVLLDFDLKTDSR